MDTSLFIWVPASNKVGCVQWLPVILYPDILTMIQRKEAVKKDVSF